MSDVTSSPTGAIRLEGLPHDDLAEWLRTMLLIRAFEGSLDALSLAGKVPGGVHVAVGQEGVAVGALRALAPDDVVASSHRPHHHAIAVGIEPPLMMAELYGRAGGTAGGKGGTMHIADFTRNYLGGNGIVGASLGLATGAALSSQVLGKERVALGFFGEGGTNIGRVWESVNLAVAWKLPLIAFCENNQYAVETPISAVLGGGSIVERARGFGLPAIHVDGQDVGAVYRAVAEARARGLRGEGPTFIEALTYRYHGHSTGQVENYRTAAEVDEWRTTRDPITRLRDALTEAGTLDDQAFSELEASVEQELAEAIAFAEASPWPDASALGTDVTAIDPKLEGNP
jgi:TPP-dependent pyruvate/acetoin dehydrogenase alpha subunit